MQVLIQQVRLAPEMLPFLTGSQGVVMSLLRGPPLDLKVVNHAESLD